MNKLRRFTEPVFWAIIVLSALPAILSNSVIPANWFLPFAVQSAFPNALDNVTWVWLGLFALGITYALVHKSMLRALATLPLLMLWYMPTTTFDVDFSHPVDAIYLDTNVEVLVYSGGGYGLPDDLIGVDSDGLGLFVSMHEVFRNLAERFPAQFGDNAEIQTLTNTQDIMIDYFRMHAGYEVDDPDRLKETAEKMGLGDFLPSQELLISAANAHLSTPSFLNALLLPKSFRTYQADTLAMPDPSYEELLLRSLAIAVYLPEADREVYAVIQSLLTLLAMIIFGLVGKYRVFYASIVLMIAAVTSVTSSTILPVFGALQVFFLIAILVFIQTFFSENSVFFRQLGRPKIRRNFFRTLAPWSFFFVLFVGSITLSAKITSLITEQVYEIAVLKSLPRNYQFFYVEKSGAGLEADLRNAAEQHYTYLNNATSSAATMFRDNYNRDSQTAIKTTMDSLKNAVMPVVFGPNDFKHCLEPPDILCPLVNEVKRQINRSYFKVRQRQLNSIRRELEALSREGKDAVNGGVDTLNSRVDAASKTASSWTVNGISGLFLWYHIISTLSIIFLAFVLIKSFLFIASRVYLHADKDNQSLWENMARQGGAGVPVPCEKTYVFDHAKWGVFFVRRRQSNKNIKRDISWPQAHRMLFRRLTTGLFALYREDWSRDHGEKFVKTTKGGEYVEWQLAKGQQVIFQLAKLAAFSETVKLRSLWSFRLSHLIFGKVLFSSVEGPGMILLRTNGEPHIGTKGDRFILGAAPNEHIAFDLATDFLVNSDLKLKNIYFSDIEVVANDSPRVVVDVMPEHSFTGGAARFIRAFFIPV